MTDRELLELAAKVAGIELVWSKFSNVPTLFKGLSSDEVWNPLTDDGDALRLAVRLEMCVDFMDRRVIAGELPEVVIDFENNDYRLAIVRAAAEIGRSMA